jgi:hypothetical protein
VAKPLAEGVNSDAILGSHPEFHFTAEGIDHALSVMNLELVVHIKSGAIGGFDKLTTGDRALPCLADTFQTGHQFEGGPE